MLTIMLSAIIWLVVITFAICHSFFVLFGGDENLGAFTRPFLRGTGALMLLTDTIWAAWIRTHDMASHEIVLTNYFWLWPQVVFLIYLLFDVACSPRKTQAPEYRQS